MCQLSKEMGLCSAVIIECDGRRQLLTAGTDNEIHFQNSEAALLFFSTTYTDLFNALIICGVQRDE